ncbi:DUF4332 domain-containing protein [Granulosicoccaceae sp. 1_MG-2023]|nr:DUF4332 domain-containing protein [Granulosicoccaceae sp. 1_MG-2023]
MAKRKIRDIEGIGPVGASKLAEAGITDTDAFLKAACSKPGRKKLAEQTGLREPQILTWANMCDLFRINGVAGQYAELLVAAGVDTVKELATRRADNLAAKMAEVNQAKKLTRQVPAQGQIAKWISEAQELPAIITH